MPLAPFARSKSTASYSLFQVYHPRLWGPPRGVEHDVWTLCASSFWPASEAEFDAPIVRHWGFDVHNMDLEVVRALDGQIFCNREKLDLLVYSVLAGGGCGLDLARHDGHPAFFDSDRPKVEFMTDEGWARAFVGPNRGAAHRLYRSAVRARLPCFSREAGDPRAPLRQHGGRSVPSHGARAIADKRASRGIGLLKKFPACAPVAAGGGCAVARGAADQVCLGEESRRYDAGWSYIGSPFPWEPLDDRGAIPNRVSTYLLAGLPVISDRRPGYYRYDELTRLGVNLDLVERDWDQLRRSLEVEARSGERFRLNAVSQRTGLLLRCDR